MREGTAKQNAEDRRRMDSNGNKLKSADVMEIKRLLLKNKNKQEIAKQFNVSVLNIRAINNKKIWSHVQL